MRGLILLISLVAVALAALWWSQRDTGPFFVSGFVEAESIRVGSRVGGRVKAVHVHEGHTAKPGETLVELEPYDLNERLAEARAQLAARKALLSKLQAGYRAEEREQARARRDRAKAVLDRLTAGLRPLEIQIRQDRLDLARANLKIAETDFDRVKRLFEQGNAVRTEMDEATNRLNAARAEESVARDELALAQEGSRGEDIAEARAMLEDAQQALGMMQAGFRAEEIAEAAAQVQAAEATVAVIERQIGELNVVTPVESIVEAIDLQPGDLIAPNAPVVSLLDLRELWVRAYVPENRLDIQLGQKVTLRVDSFPGRRFAGHVSFVSRDAEFTPSNAQTPEERSKQVFRIKVIIDEGRDVLRAGMSADVFLDGGK